MKNRVKDVAPDGQVWVCYHCGRYDKDPYRLDVSCFINAVLCYEDSIVTEDGRAVKATKVEEDGGDRRRTD